MTVCFTACAGKQHVACSAARESRLVISKGEHTGVPLADCCRAGVGQEGGAGVKNTGVRSNCGACDSGAGGGALCGAPRDGRMQFGATLEACVNGARFKGPRGAAGLPSFVRAYAPARRAPTSSARRRGAGRGRRRQGRKRPRAGSSRSTHTGAPGGACAWGRQIARGSHAKVRKGVLCFKHVHIPIPAAPAAGALP
ncbi:MAG: hypothetical protein J3K34DRAFT_418243 [Monoraphidium minutum]|nr:MAG: hypothetical protein J3K34DRAFT_418243 [Monoraphidium minutum]